MEYVTIGKDIVIAIAALVGAIVSVVGLYTWRIQLKGKVEYELSKRILVNLYKYIDAVNDLRNPVIFVSEMPSPTEAGGISEDEVRYYGYAEAYKKRWENVSRKMTDLSTDMYEAEATWGEGHKGVFDKLLNLHRELYKDLKDNLIIENPKTKEHQRKSLNESWEKKSRHALTDGFSDEDDPFIDDVKMIKLEMEKFLNRKLSRR